MGLIIKPSIEVGELKMQADPNSKNVNSFIEEVGRNIPVVKIGNYVLGMSELLSFSISIRVNKIPYFTMSVLDEQFSIRENLKNDVDKGIIFYGYKNWNTKFNCIFDKTYTDEGESVISLSGKLFNENLYQGIQFSYKDLTVLDLLTQTCKKSKMGLYVYENTDLIKSVDYSLMTGTRFYDYFQSVLQNYTDNFYSIDTNYFFHVSNIDTLRKQKTNTYTLDYRTGESIPEKPIILKSIIREGSAEKDYEIPIKFYTFNTNYSEIHQETYSEYSLGIGGKGEKIITSRSDIGIGSNKTNTFAGFEKHKNPFYGDKINKAIGGNVITCLLEFPIFEIVPFTAVETKIYLPYRMGESMKLDAEHSGKKIVIGYDIDFDRSERKENLNMLKQKLFLI